MCEGDGIKRVKGLYEQIAGCSELGHIPYIVLNAASCIRPGPRIDRDCSPYRTTDLLLRSKLYTRLLYKPSDLLPKNYERRGHMYTMTTMASSPRLIPYTSLFGCFLFICLTIQLLGFATRREANVPVAGWCRCSAKLDIGDFWRQ